MHTVPTGSRTKQSKTQKRQNTESACELKKRDRPENEKHSKNTKRDRKTTSAYVEQKRKKVEKRVVQ